MRFRPPKVFWSFLKIISAEDCIHSTTTLTLNKIGHLFFSQHCSWKHRPKERMQVVMEPRHSRTTRTEIRRTDLSFYFSRRSYSLISWVLVWRLEWSRLPVLLKWANQVSLTEYQIVVGPTSETNNTNFFWQIRAQLVPFLIWWFVCGYLCSWVSVAFPWMTEVVVIWIWCVYFKFKSVSCIYWMKAILGLG